MVSMRPFVASARSGNDHCPRPVRITIGRRWAAWHGDRTSELTRMVNVRTPRGRPQQAITAPRQTPQWPRARAFAPHPWNGSASRRGGRDQAAASGGQYHPYLSNDVASQVATVSRTEQLPISKCNGTTRRLRLQVPVPPHRRWSPRRRRRPARSFPTLCGTPPLVWVVRSLPI